jgi:hypothetical protein
MPPRCDFDKEKGKILTEFSPILPIPPMVDALESAHLIRSHRRPVIARCNYTDLQSPPLASPVAPSNIMTTQASR